ncbi:hypothetical protein FLA_2708 [Filimonas lacunae]|nr:hypothetical protein FLA_2708 [Filimonas lacunae]
MIYIAIQLMPAVIIIGCQSAILRTEVFNISKIKQHPY